MKPLGLSVGLVDRISCARSIKLSPFLLIMIFQLFTIMNVHKLSSLWPLAIINELDEEVSGVPLDRFSERYFKFII